MLGGVFLRGFTEAIGVAVALVAAYLLLNVVVIGVGLWQIATHPHVVPDWTDALTRTHGDPIAMIAVSLMVFPSLGAGHVRLRDRCRRDAARARERRGHGSQPGSPDPGHAAPVDDGRADHERLPR
ncbi:hypothetical protein [Nocardioides sp. B-3]|uniref:hypothetical protein n=1 Tax=Nocardioides sp. B-3 TaxID=2895565 RepID=UPI002200DC65|nr:hypothetical protein LP418_22420 [Nocardioides sp. B-3]